MQNEQLTKRELHLQLAEIETANDLVKFSINLLTALKTGAITLKEYELFNGSLLMYHGELVRRFTDDQPTP